MKSFVMVTFKIRKHNVNSKIIESKKKMAVDLIILPFMHIEWDLSI